MISFCGITWARRHQLLGLYCVNKDAGKRLYLGFGVFFKYLIIFCSLKTTFWVFKRNPSADFAEDGDHVVIEWNSFPKEEIIKSNGYWHHHEEGTQDKRTHPLVHFPLSWVEDHFLSEHYLLESGPKLLGPWGDLCSIWALVILVT